jgi:hypothetical protein
MVSDVNGFGGIAMRRIFLWTSVLVFSAQLVLAQQPAEDKEKDADFCLARALGNVAMSETVEWDASMEVIKAPAKQDSKYPMHVGITDYHFRVKGEASTQKDFMQAFWDLQSFGDAWLHWEEKVRGEGDKPTRQVWSKGDVFLLRSSKAPDKLVSIKVFQGDGMKDGVRDRILGGGVIGWRLGSGIDRETSRAQYASIFVADSPRWVKEDTVAGRDSVVLDVTIYIVACRYYPVGTGRIWIDRKTHLIIQRRTTLNMENDEPIWIVNEVYSNWKLGQPIAEEKFQPDSR